MVNKDKYNACWSAGDNSRATAYTVHSAWKMSLTLLWNAKCQCSVSVTVCI